MKKEYLCFNEEHQAGCPHKLKKAKNIFFVKKRISYKKAIGSFMPKKRLHKPCFCDSCLGAYYWQPCTGCKDGHPSFWKTVIESPQWKKWQEEQMKNPTYDISEVEECGIISPKHFQDFLKFIK